MTWLEFIIDNFIPGRVKDISSHIENVAREKKYNTTSKSIGDTVRQILPMHTEGVFKDGSNRELKKIYFKQDKITKIYTLLNKTVFDVLDLSLNTEVKDQFDKGQINIRRDKNLSVDHEKMIKIMAKYAKENKIYSSCTAKDIDFLTLKDQTFSLYEVKSSSKEVYKAIGQSIVYRKTLCEIYPDYEFKSIIVGNFELPKKYISSLIEADISYMAIEEFT